MTTAQSPIYRAAIAYSNLPSEEHLGELVTAVMDLPMSQWPENACERKLPFGTRDDVKRGMKIWIDSSPSKVLAGPDLGDE